MSNGDGPTTVGDWIKYLHAAEQDLRQGPTGEHYQEALEAAGLAARHLHALQVGQQMEDANAPVSTALGAGVGEALDVLGSGTGEPISGLASLVQGKGFRAGAERYREARSTLEEEHPTAANIGVGAGMLGQAALGAGQAVAARGMQAGVPLTIPQIAGTLARGGATAGALGAVGGFSRGGEDPGDIGARFGQAGKDALYSALLGSLLTGVGIAGTRAHLEHVADLTARGNARELTAQRLANARTAGSRMTRSAPTSTQAELGEDLGTKAPAQPLHPDAAQALRDFEAGRISETDLQDALDFARGKKLPDAPEAAKSITDGPPGSGLRPGEAAQEIPGTEGRGIEITGTRSTPAPPTTPTILELQEGPQDPVNHWSSNQPPSQVGVASPQITPDQLPMQQYLILKQALESGDPGMIAAAKSFLAGHIAP